LVVQMTKLFTGSLIMFERSTQLFLFILDILVKSLHMMIEN